MPQHSQKTQSPSRRLDAGSVPRAREIESERSEGESIEKPLKSKISKENSKKNVR